MGTRIPILITAPFTTIRGRFSGFLQKKIWTPVIADCLGFAGVFSWGSGKLACFGVVFCGEVAVF